MHHNSRTSLLAQILESILDLHVFCAEGAVTVLKEWGVHGYQFAESAGLDLVNEIINGISIHKTSLLRVVSMDVKVEGESIVLV